MKEDQNLPEGHITLKEAAALSGYAPDYVGQLIRKGKLYGRQVYYKAVWVTTKEALQEYIKKEAESGEVEKGGPVAEKVQSFKNWLVSESRLTVFLKVLIYVGLAISIVFSLVLFYALSVSIDHSLEQHAIQTIEQNAHQ